MQSQWRDSEAQIFSDDPLALRVYTSRLLGQETSLVLHGGGNTSVKDTFTNLFGESFETLYIKGSGWDLATIEKAGFSPVRMDSLQKLGAMKNLSDSTIVREQRSALLDPFAPDPSIEAILHAIIPFKYVDHTHADAVVALTNTPSGEGIIREVYSDRVLIIPYVMAGFILARKVAQITASVDWGKLDGMILMNHGVFSFADSARQSYEEMIKLVSMAEDFLEKRGALQAVVKAQGAEDLLALSRIRKAVSHHAGQPMIALHNASPEACGFSNRPDAADLATRGSLTPDHVIRTKRIPVMIGDDVDENIAGFSSAYRAYFDRNTDSTLTMLDPAPRWAVWPGYGIAAFGSNIKAATIVADIAEHTIRAIQWAEAIGGWRALTEKDLFAVEYWELEQAKLKKGGARLPLEGKIALVTGAASGIGHACVLALHGQGVAVIGLDINPDITDMLDKPSLKGMACDVTKPEALDRAVQETIRLFGGLDVVISNAGIFPAGRSLEAMDQEEWRRSMEINLHSHQMLLQASIPFLRNGIDPAIVVIGSKNVPAPGPKAGAYSVAKAGLTQLARVAALELAADGIRVNVIHPNAVFDTGVWTQDVLASRAAVYGLSVDEYRKNNLLHVEIRSTDVAAMACAMAGTVFSKTTGAQVPIDGGNERVI